MSNTPIFDELDREQPVRDLLDGFDETAQAWRQALTNIEQHGTETVPPEPGQPE